MIWNPPSAWAVAKRDAPQVAEDCWTFPNPRRAERPVDPDPAVLLWRLVVQPEQAGGKDLLTICWTRADRDALTSLSSGYDIPPYATMTDFKVWEEVDPPKGTVYNYPSAPA